MYGNIRTFQMTIFTIDILLAMCIKQSATKDEFTFHKNGFVNRHNLDDCIDFIVDGEVCLLKQTIINKK